MKQFILTGEPGGDGRIRLEGGDYQYLVKVRRLAPGEYFPARLPGGAMVTVRVVSVDSRALVGEVAEISPVSAPAESLPHLILYQALPKSDKMDLIVRQAAEGAVAEIVPFVSEFSVAKTGAQKIIRWERIIKEARQQSGSPEATVIRQPVSADGLFSHWDNLKTRWPGILGLLFHHLPLANESLHGYLGTRLETNPPEAVVITIGPEGGFSPAEAERFMAAGFQPFTIGDTVLRTETAALYAQAAVRILLLEKNSWKMK